MGRIVDRCREIASRADKCRGCTKCKDGPRRVFRGRWCFEEYAFQGCINYIGSENMARIELANDLLELAGDDC